MSTASAIVLIAVVIGILVEVFAFRSVQQVQSAPADGAPAK